jgi:hypothetical protein
MAARLRFEGQHEGRVRGDINAGDVIHLDGDS